MSDVNHFLLLCPCHDSSWLLKEGEIPGSGSMAILKKLPDQQFWHLRPKSCHVNQLQNQSCWPLSNFFSSSFSSIFLFIPFPAFPNTLLLLSSTHFLADNTSCRTEGHPSKKIKEFNKDPKHTGLYGLKT